MFISMHVWNIGVKLKNLFRLYTLYKFSLLFDDIPVMCHDCFYGKIDICKRLRVDFFWYTSATLSQIEVSTGKIPRFRL